MIKKKVCQKTLVKIFYLKNIKIDFFPIEKFCLKNQFSIEFFKQNLKKIISW